jgi:hypothetical protein
MNESKHTITFSMLLDRCQQVMVPQIQRDYAQGRDSEREVRESFLNALHEALALPVGHERLPLNLDFIYGSMDDAGGRCFLPLDGQQRLTTLFLLHWYLAWRDKQLPQFRNMVWDGKHSRFLYRVRPSSTEFFDELVNYEPACEPDAVPTVKKMIEDQPWFFLYWRLDPTIQSALTMLDALHARFWEAAGLYARLVDDRYPVITFQLLELEHFGLSDDLYIKMNARGKPLTAFETFKARFEEHLKQLYPTERRQTDEGNINVPQFFARRMDTRWTDFFWGYKDEASDSFDDAVMNLLWALARVSLDPESPSFTGDTTLLRNRHMGMSYTTFHEHGWLTRTFADRFMCLLEAWSTLGGRFTPQLPNNRYFDELGFFQKAMKAPATLEYVELVQFAAFLSYLQRNDCAIDANEFQAWARVVFNLSENSTIERPEDYGRSLSGIQTLLPHCRKILEDLAVTEIEPVGFSPQQVQEEVLKAKLILADPGWIARIEAAELHGYFRGQIQFLLDFAGVCSQAEEVPVSEWANDVNAELQTRFDDYFAKALLTFSETGLIGLTSPRQSFLWERVLFVCGDYLSSNSTNYSFLTNPAGNWDSWKRFLRGDASGDSPRRRYLKDLWDRIDAKTDIAQQLDQIVRGRSGLEPWREAVVKYPQVIEYCEQREIRRRGDVEEIYLLKKRQMNGAHAELFSYALYQELNSDTACERLAPLKLKSYQSVSMIETEPYVLLAYDLPDCSIGFSIESTEGKFRIKVKRAALESHPEVEAVLSNQMGFVGRDDVLARSSSRDEIHDVLHGVARSLANLAIQSVKS